MIDDAPRYVWLHSVSKSFFITDRHTYMLVIALVWLRHLSILRGLILMARSTLEPPRLVVMEALEVRLCMNMDVMFVERCMGLLPE